MFPFPLSERYYHYSRWLKAKFGGPVRRLCVDAGFTCPTRDGTLGTAGCLYCDNRSFSAERSGERLSVTAQIETRLTQISDVHQKFLVYFQPYTNTYAGPEILEKVYREALTFPQVVGLIIGTRPDCVDEEKLNLLAELNREVFISVEYGIESVYDKTLHWIRRGHTFAHTEWAITQGRHRGLHVGAHIIYGFPTETREEILASVDVINRLHPDALKIHHLHIVKGAPLERLYREHPFPVFAADDWVKTVCDVLERLRPTVVIQRLVGEACGNTLIAPRWTQSKNTLLTEINREFDKRGTHQGFLYRENQE